MHLKERMKLNPMTYYTFSIVASWAGVGSLMNFKTLTVNSGITAAIIWAVFNCLACMVFGVVCDKVPTMRDVFFTRPVKWFVGIMTFFQAWTQMTGIKEIWGETPIGTTGGTVIAYAVCILFIAILLKFGTIRNALTDWTSWTLVYGLLVIVTAIAFAVSGNFIEFSTGCDTQTVGTGLYNGCLLLCGPFTYAYFYELLKYNESNEDGVTQIKMVKPFVMAGVCFAIYMAFACALAVIDFPPALSVAKAILISVVAVSSLSTYLYGGYICFGKKVGLAINIFICVFWYFVAPLGVMGLWTLMCQIRTPFVLAMLVVAIIWKHKKGVNNADY